MGCLACQGRDTLHEDVEPLTQYASAELIEAIAYRGHDSGRDPRWASSGAADRAEYGRWCGHACGTVCLRMVLIHRDGWAPPLMHLVRQVRAAGGYVERADGSIHGLVYAPFVDHVRRTHGLEARVRTGMGVADVLDELDRGRMVIASVHKEIRRPRLAAPGRGGHLVLVVGHREGLVHLRNPSGHTPASRSAALAAKTFGEFFAGRGIVVDLSVHG